MTLLDALRSTGLTVHTVPHWETNGKHWPIRAPFGIMHHHTTAPIPYPISWLDGSGDGRVKCNVNIKQDGTVWLVNGRTCNYASGPGSAVVLAETQMNRAPFANARDRGLPDTTVGNNYYFNIENDHAGLGGPLPAAQHDAILKVTRAALDFYGLKPNQVISHAEWTARKVDPYWNGSTRTVEAIRLELEDDMPTADEIRQIIREETPSAVLGAEFGGPVGSPNRRSFALHILDIKSRVFAPSPPVDEAAIAKAVVAAMTPGLRAAVAAELADLKLQATP